MQTFCGRNQFFPEFFVKFVHYFSSNFYELEFTNFSIDKSPPLCYNGLAFGRIFFVHWLVFANYLA